jgi:hypothetical protein
MDIMSGQRLRVWGYDWGYFGDVLNKNPRKKAIFDKRGLRGRAFDWVCYAVPQCPMLVFGTARNARKIGIWSSDAGLFCAALVGCSQTNLGVFLGVSGGIF